MEPYSADRSLYGKLRRRVARLVTQKPATLSGLRRPLLTISFDDAPVSAARDGAEILKKHGVHGTYFISTGLSGQDSHLGRYTTAEDIKAVYDAGHEIACHTHTHIDCGRASARDIAQELQRIAADGRTKAAKPKTRTISQRRVAGAARRGVSVREIAASEEMSESEVRLRLQIAGAAKEKAHATVR